MQELRAERQAIKTALDELQIDAWVYEDDAGARDQSTRSTYLDELQGADIYIGMFWKKYGGYTIDEYRQSATWQKPCLIFVKTADEQERDEPLRKFLAEIADVDSGRATHWFTSPDELRDFVKRDVARWQAGLVRRFTDSAFAGPFQVEALSDQYVERRELLDRAKEQWLGRDTSEPRVTRAAFHGLAGSGKSVLARAFAHEPEVQRMFPDGVLWTTLERNDKQAIDLTQPLSAWGRALRDPTMPPAGYPDKVTASAQLRSLLKDKAILLIVDDVWEEEHVRPFLVGGPRCLLLLTLRRRQIADALGASSIESLPMSAAEALALIERWCGALAAADRVIAATLAEDLGFLPLALELMAGQAKTLGWKSYEDRWREQKLMSLKRGRRAAGRENNVFDSINLSFESLDKADAADYEQLALFGPNILFPASAAAAVLGLSEPEAEDLLADLSGQALLKRAMDGGVPLYSLHSLLDEFLTERVGDRMPALHGKLIDGYLRRSQDGKLAGVPDDGYFARRLSFHLVAAGRLGDLWALIDKPWMDAQFKRGLSQAAFLADVHVALQAARAQSPAATAAFVRCAVIYMLVINARGEKDPDNLIEALIESDQLQIALTRAGAHTRGWDRSTRYCVIVDALLKQGRQLEARAAAEQAVLAAQSEVNEFRGAENLAQAALRLCRAGGNALPAIAAARAATGPERSSEAIEREAAIAEALYAAGQTSEADTIVEGILDTVESERSESVIYMFSGPASLLNEVGPITALHRLRDLAIDLVHRGLDPYCVQLVTPVLARRGEVDSALEVAALIPPGYERAAAMAQIATALIELGETARAQDLFTQAVELVLAELRKSTGYGSQINELLDVAGLLGEVAAVDRLAAESQKLDAVWRSWLYAAIAKVHAKAGSDRSRITALADASLNLLRTAMKEKELHGETLRAQAAGYLADAGALEQALAMADDIADASSQREALASIAKALLKANRSAEARPLLMRAMLAGQPTLAYTLSGIAQAAKWLARVGERDRAVSTVDSVLKKLDALEAGDAKIGIQLAAVETLEHIGDRARAAALATEMLATFVDGSVVTYDHVQRSDAFQAAGRLLPPDVFDRNLALMINWYYRRSISRGVIKALLAQNNTRAREFADAITAERNQYAPFDERERIDALAALFERPDATHRDWILNLAGSLHSMRERSVLLARASRTLARESDDRANALARSAVEFAVNISDTEQRDLALQEVGGIISPAAEGSLVLEAVSTITDPEWQSDACASAAEAFARRGDTAMAVTLLDQMKSANRRNNAIEPVATELMAAKKYDAGIALFDRLPLTTAFNTHYGIAHAAAALARDGERDRAAALLDEGMSGVCPAGERSFGLITARLGLAAARLSRVDVARKLAAQAQDEDDGSFGPFVSATAAAVYALTGDTAAMALASARAVEQLEFWDMPEWQWGLSVIGNILREGNVHDIDAYLPLLDAADDPQVKSVLIGVLARIGGASMSPERRAALIEKATAIEDAWPRVRSLVALAESAAAARDLVTLSRLLEMAGQLDNHWARDDLVAVLAKEVAPLDDTALLNAVLAKSSALGSRGWKSVQALAHASSALFRKGQVELARDLAERAFEIAKTQHVADATSRAEFGAEEAMRLAILGRTDDARPLIQHAINALPDATTYHQRQLLDVLDRATEETRSRELLSAFSTAALALKSPVAANTARNLARLGHLDEASKVVARVKEQWPSLDAGDRSASQCVSATTLVALGSHDEARNALLDSLDSGRTAGPWAQPAVYTNLAEGLHDLGDTAALISMCDTLTATVKWWDR